VAALAEGGLLLVCGGTDGEIPALDDCLTWNTAASPAGAWTHHSYLNEGRMGGAMVRLLNTVYASGGSDAFGGGLEHLDSANEGGSKWQYGPNLPAGVRSVTGHCSLPWGADGLLLIGGVYTTSEIIVSRDVLLYNTTTRQWSAWPSLLSRRRNLACTRLNATHILVAGGDNDSGDTEVGHTSEILEVGGGRGWRSVGRLSMDRKGGQLAVINGGRAVIVGGYSTAAASFLNTIEEFSLDTERWTVVEKRLQLPRGAYGLSTVPNTYC
jgi:N-acetylneuraminic acid mutarotase